MVKRLVRPVPIKNLSAWNPLRNTIWGFSKPILRKEIRQAISEKRFVSDPYGSKRWTRKKHVERIAYLVVNHSMDPISIDVGVPSLGCYVSWIIQDGNHRLASAIYRRDQYIVAELSGDLDIIESMVNDNDFDSSLIC